MLTLRRVLGILLTSALLSCGGGGQKVTKSSTVAPTAAQTNKKVDPKSVKQDLKSPTQAVILGTDDKNGSTVIPLVAAKGQAQVDALFVRTGGGEKASGGFSPVKLSTAPNNDDSVEVSIGEEFSGGTGPQWRAGVWISAFVAATTLNKDLTDFSFQASSVGYIDGPSASGLMAAGFIASMTGDKVDPTVTMTGIINPDGTIGPVGGIPEKFAGSIEKGKKRLGYPIGMRYARSEATGETVDLVALAKDKGAEAVEIANVHDAYKLITGKSLPEVVPVTEKEMEVDEDTSKAIDAKYDEWKKRLMEQWSGITALAREGKLPETLITVAQSAQEAGNAAEKLHQQGYPAAALSKIFEAWVYAITATSTYSILQSVQKGDVAGAIKQVDDLSHLEAVTTAVFDKIGKVKPNTLGGHLQMISAFQAALRAWSFQVYATEGLANTKTFLERLRNAGAGELASPDIADELVAQISPAVLNQSRTLAEAIQANEILQYETEKSLNYQCSLGSLKRLATSFQSASAAAVTYFESLAGIADDTTRQRAAMIEPDYLVSYLNSRLNNATGTIGKFKDTWGEKSLPWGLMSLAGSQLAYFRSAQLVAKYYSLQVSHDRAGRATAVEHEKAFINMLASAERTARTSARSARIATGAIPVQSKLAYQVAQLDREGTMDDKIHALTEYWAASAFAQAAVMLARN